MATYTSAAVEQLLSDADLAFTNAGDNPELQGPLAEYGIDADYIARGTALVEEAQSAYDTFRSEWADVQISNQQVAEADAAARALYSRHLTLARLAVEADSPAYVQLGLDGGRNWKRRKSWMGDAREMYVALLTDASLRETVAPYPIDAQAGLDALDALRSALNSRANEQGEAEQATQSRDAVIGELRGLLSDFLTVADLAFADDRQQLEKLGVTAPSR